MEPSTSETGYRCKICDRPFRKTQTTNIAVEEFLSEMMHTRCPHCGADSSSLSFGEHLSLQEDERRRISGTVADRALNWKRHGETGSSSLDIWKNFTNQPLADAQAPGDLDDVRRCVLLFHHMPEWLELVDQMARFPQWEKLAPRWKELQATYLADCPNLRGRSPAAGTILSECLESIR